MYFFEKSVELWEGLGDTCLIVDDYRTVGTQCCDLQCHHHAVVMMGRIVSSLQQPRQGAVLSLQIPACKALGQGVSFNDKLISIDRRGHSHLVEHLKYRLRPVAFLVGKAADSCYPARTLTE